MKIQNLKTKIGVTFVLFIFTVILYTTRLSCPFLKFFKLPCPGCGMTRALISAIQFNFAEAFYYHKMFWSVPILYICFLKDGKLFKNKDLNIAFYMLIIIGFLTNWVSNIVKFC